ncbi:ImmA/IrrE family metallo-endopeptidase [Kutzneria buriramensis]|uniref:Uncharacterized protein DUF955 n=1 Tax=Kutzneria buriramensis TaxID=1045776 RepID=A0A3E0G699_9PSEU|nr:ImmA/IrrE family metallo-endopeptidase [Kutzneria buriramensis]REH18165.1 uncharacterized protein DUF955 [Kutzneria buriramensis]
MNLRQRRTLRRLHRRCSARLAGLALGDLHRIRAQLSQRRGRPIHLLPATLGATAPSGCWLAVGEADFIVYDANTSTPHQEHIIAHELGHMICGHRGVLDDTSIDTLFPGLDPRLVREVLHRTGYTDDQEQEAEILATLMLHRLPGHDPVPEHTPVTRRIRDSLA